MSDNGPSSVAVMADAQLGVVSVLKPFSGFEAVYQGHGGAVPILFPGTKDPQAGQPGYAPNLEAGLKVSPGARVLLWIPVAVVFSGGSSHIVDYNYVLHWRYRNVADFRRARIPYHFPRQSPGAADTTLITGGPRLVIPAANDTLIYEQPEPAAGAATGIMRVVQQAYQIGDGGGMQGPLLPDGTVGALQQGLLDPFTAGTAVAGRPIFQPVWCDAMGDELIISVTRTDPAAAWDFSDANIDLPFSNIYGTANGAHPNYPDVGIYVMQGAAP